MSSTPGLHNQAVASDAPAAAADPAVNPVSYKNQCAAMGVKANSRILKHEAALLDQSRLDFSLNYIGGAGLQAATDAMSRNPNLEVLVVAGNGLTNDSVVFLCRGLRTHPKLHTLDLSNNPISLPAGLALIELVRGNAVLRDVKLAGTLVDEAVQAKLRRLININRQRREKIEAAAAAAASAAADGSSPPTAGGTKSVPGVPTPYQRAVREYEVTTARRTQAKAARLKSLEETAAVGVSEELKALGTKGPARGKDGWAVVTLYVSTAPYGFASELQLIHDVIVPRLNRRFAGRKVAIVPMSMYHGVPPLSKERAKSAPKRVAVLADHQDALLKTAPFFLQLVGDKVGLSEFAPAAAVSDAGGSDKHHHPAAQPFSDAPGAPKAHVAKHRAVPHLVADGARMLERELALAPEDSLRLVMRRCPALSMGAPAALVASVTDDPHVVHPDPNTHMIKVAVAKAQGIEHPRHEEFDFDALKQIWSKHVAYRASLEKRLPAPFLVDYKATFQDVDALGQVQLQNLEAFESAITRRLEAALEHLYPIPGAADGSRNTPAAALASKLHVDEAFVAARHRAVLQDAVASTVGRKGIAGKLDLYTVTPPSRNSALITCTPGSGATSVAMGYAVRSAQKQSYILATHFATQPWLCDQPSDLRAALLNLAKQLTPDKEIPLYMQTEVDINKIKDFFAKTLSTTSGDAKENKTVIVMLDGIDDIDPAVLPCRSLRVNDAGADEWDPPADQRSVQKPLPAVTHRVVDTHDWIPICLGRNTRVVVTAQRDSEAHKTLELRGHDSCDGLPLGDIGDNDVESIVMRECEALGVYLRDEEVATIRGKPDARVPAYLQFVLDYVRRREESTQYTTRLTGLTQLPGTLAEMCDALLDSLEKELGLAFARTLVSLVLASRWGLSEWELRVLLRQQSQQVKEAGGGVQAKIAASKAMQAGATPSADNNAAYAAMPLLNGELFQRILRILRPVLTDHKQFLAWTRAPVNALDATVHIRCRVFRHVASRRYMSDDAVFLTAHHQLSHHYRRLMGAAGPLESKAVREFPFHVVRGEMWGLLETHVASLDFVSQAYLHRLGYEALRELVRAYNTIDDIATERAEAKTAVRAPPSVAGKSEPTVRSVASSAAHLSDVTIEALKLKLREYCYFVKQHNVNLVQYPHMVRQIAITCAPESCLHHDARDYFRQLEKFPHFVVMNKSRVKLHQQTVSDAAFAPSGLRIATTSEDRTVKICGLTGEPLVSVNQSVSKVLRVCFSGTSRYVAAACQDRTLMVIDPTNGNLISRPNGHSTTIKSLALSARGKFLFSGGEDRLVKVWEPESGAEYFTTSLVGQSHHTSPHGSVNAILPHPSEEEIFFTMVDKKLIGWRVKSSALDEATELLCIIGHNSLPLATCHIVGDGDFAITCAKDLSAATAHTTRSEDNIKAWSLRTGRCLATLTLGARGASGHIATVVSPDEKILAASAFDGGLDLYKLDFRSWAPVSNPDAGSGAADAGSAVIVTPYRMLSAFREHPSPKLAFCRFSFDSRYVAAVGNQRQLKVWETEVAGATEDATASPTTSPGSPNKAGGDSYGGSLLTALSAADRTIAEFLMDQPATCMDWTSAPVEEGGEIIVGDQVGKLHALKLKR